MLSKNLAQQLVGFSTAAEAAWFDQEIGPDHAAVERPSLWQHRRLLVVFAAAFFTMGAVLGVARATVSHAPPAAIAAPAAIPTPAPGATAPAPLAAKAKAKPGKASRAKTAQVSRGKAAKAKPASKATRGKKATVRRHRRAR